MLRRIIACLLLGAFCCTLAACSSGAAPAPVTKDATNNPNEAAKKTGSSPVGSLEPQ
jgi:hypothetical protein